MKLAAFAVVAAACGSRGGASDSTVPPDVIGESVQATRVDKGHLTRFSNGKAIDGEDFEVTTRGDGFLFTSENEQWKLSMQVSSKWNVTFLELDLEDRFRQFPRKCSAKLQRNGDVMEWSVAVDGGEPTVRDREPVGGGGVYWINMKPASTQIAVCAVAGTAAVSFHNYPAFTVELSPRETIDLGDGRKLDKVVVDGLVDVYCDGTRLAAVHYSKHALLAVRDEYEAWGVALARSDPTDAVWPGELRCPEPAK